MKTTTGEEGLECLFKMRIKLYRFRDETQFRDATEEAKKEWKERGIGNAKLLRDKETKRIRLVMRQEKTKKPIANFMRK